MIKDFRKFGVLLVLVCAMLLPAIAFAGSTLNTPTVKYIDNEAIGSGDAVSINDVIITESSTTSFEDSSGGKFTIKIPEDITLASSVVAKKDSGAFGLGTTGETDNVLNTSVLGTASSPHGLYLEASNNTTGGVIFAYHTASGGADIAGSHIGLIQVYPKAGGASSSYQYGTGFGYGSDKARVANFLTFATYSSSSIDAQGGGTAKVGEIYYDSTTKEIVMTLAAKGRDTSAFLEQIILSGMKVAPRTTTGTDAQALTFSDGAAAGAFDLLGITDGSAEVVSLSDQALEIKGAASGAANAPPIIPAGSTVIDGQGIGRIHVIVVGEADNINNKLTIALDNGAVFHTGAVNAAYLGGTTSGKALTIGGTPWGTYDDARTGESLVVNALGELVITLGTPKTALQSQSVIEIPRSTTTNVIDTSSLTASSDINATVTGDGTDWTGISGQVKVADAQMKGTTVSFGESSGATELTTLYAGRKGETTDDKVKIAETSPTSLTAGGTISLAVNLGAKFTTADTISAAQETATTYTSSNLVLPSLTMTSAVASKTGTVTTASSTNKGIWYYSSFNFNLANATAGDLIITVGGTAGASGSVTIATVKNATATTVSSATGILVPGSAFDVPDIVITEPEAGALAASTIGLKFPSGFSLDDSGVSVSATAGSDSTAAVTWGDVSSDEASYAYLSVASQSTTTTGLYTITISGLKATPSTTAGAGDASFTVAGGTTTWSSTSASFDANSYAKPAKEDVVFGTIVSANVPTLGAAVQSGTVITQTFIPASGDIGKTGDLYVFTGTGDMYWTGSAWTATETALTSGAALGSTDVKFDTDGLTASSKIYIGYGIGLTGTFAKMNSDATVVLAHTTAAITPVAVGGGAGEVTSTINTTDTYDLTVNVTPASGDTPASEWLVYQVIVGGTSSGWWFFTASGTEPYVAGMDLSTVTYDFAATGGSTFNVGEYLLGTYLPNTGDQLILAYVYTTGTLDLTDSSTFTVDNVVTLTQQ